ncbi:hypothetical protein BGZ61DRAFT_364987 [Ilyonectria robusta]|uniref:uncharacterized protein n=1 Tax=Ilyonectria robusta TaxID=1079257 RepID=UPI001E8E3361|nr:uncharacterized protein BGZ61DRAFT_364987 [Ilyonectria robusta]KAH8667818.1 hypothetical protein BGZ61DRAFT_364987 [Ilyonectria robusta]
MFSISARLITLASLCSWVFLAVSAQQDLLVFKSGLSNRKLASQNSAPDIWVDSDDFKGIQKAASDLAIDFGRVVGVNGTVRLLGKSDSRSKPVSLIIAGAVGHSTLIDGLVSDGKLDVSEIEGKWEAYTSAFVKNPLDGVSWALVVAGSDVRGTIFGLYDISEKIGVSPWYWWADVPPKKKTDIWVQETRKVQGSPSVKYRGFFINDEAPALTSWAEPRFRRTANGRPFTGEFYKLIFELCLRLRANYIWPAMWGSMFYVDDKENGPNANDYGVFIGTSHHEPMARAETEQQQQLEGSWDWIGNKKNITEFFRGGAERAKDWDTIFTMGMRGAGDVESPTLTSDSLEEILKVQQSILKDVLDVKDLGQVPQTWVLYKEVGRYYQAGMEVPDTVTLLWTDDNAGNLLRTPFANETDREAGAGVYYHFDYVGAPRSYKWINTIQLVKTWEQMHLAYEKGAREIWIANVGDLKPLEIPMTHFLDMAYDMSKHTTPDSTTEWIKRWAIREFGKPSIADTIARILNTYGKLIVRRKYELLSREPFAYSVSNYDEAERVIKEWSDLVDLTQSVYDALPQDTQIPFFEMVLHPVLAGKTVVELYIKAALNAWHHSQRRTSTDRLAKDVNDLFAQDAEITDRYHSLKDGKWDPILNQTHIGYTFWNEPPVNAMPNVSYHTKDNVPQSGIMGVSVQGSSRSSPGDPEPTLLSVDRYMPPSEKRYLDIFTRDNGTFSYKITPNASYVTVSNSRGTLKAPGEKSDIRSFISVDWSKAPKGLSWVGLKVSAANGRDVTAVLPVNKTSVPKDFHGYVESGGVVSIEAEHYTSAEKKGSLSYTTIPYYGRTLSGVKLWPATADSQTPSSAPKLTYSFHTFNSRSSARVMVFLGATLNHDPSRPLKYAFAIDGRSPVTVQPVPTTPMGSVPDGWEDAVIPGGWTSISTVELSAGSHQLSLWLLEPGVVVQKLVVDVGGFKSSSLGPPESYKV